MNYFNFGFNHIKMHVVKTEFVGLFYLYFVKFKREDFGYVVLTVLDLYCAAS